ncbi:hypothetical protein GCM10027346_02820 [Hymenobacter seoulensis]
MHLISKVLITIASKQQVRYLHVAFAYVFLGSFYFFYDQLAAPPPPSVQELTQEFAHIRKAEAFDPQLRTLTSVDQLVDYTTELVQTSKVAAQDSSLFPKLLSSVLRRKFYHNYSYFGNHNIKVAELVARIAHTDWNAIVLPDDIMRHSQAACSQQSIVFMAALRRKGYPVRKVGFSGPQIVGGHFALETYYNGAWHYFDTNLEPDSALLSQHNRPSIAALVANKALLHQAYRGRLDSLQIAELFPTYKLGKVNAAPAPRAHAFQLLMKAVTYGGWVVVLLVWVLITWYLRRITHRHMQLPSLERTKRNASLRISAPRLIVKSHAIQRIGGHFNWGNCSYRLQKERTL